MSMYALNPIVILPDQLSLPKVMYELSNIQNEGESKESIADDFSRQKNIPVYHCLEARQMKILKQLKELKQHVEYLCVAVRLSNTVKLLPANLPFIDRNIPTNKNSICTEIIVNADPSNPPYSILALQRIWKDTKFNVDLHQHSTTICTIMNNFEEKLLTEANGKTIHTVDIKLIWKNVSNIQFVTKIYSYPLEGEANFLRYLTRLIKNYDYENSKSLEDIVLIDTILDICFQLSYEEPKTMNIIVTKFASYLSKNPWLLNFSNPSIADIAAWSVIKQKACNRIPCELNNWYYLCEKTFLS